MTKGKSFTGQSKSCFENHIIIYYMLLKTLMSLKQLGERVPPRNYNNDKPMELNGIIETIFAIIKIFVHLVQKYYEMFYSP